MHVGYLCGVVRSVVHVGYLCALILLLLILCVAGTRREPDWGPWPLGTWPRRPSCWAVGWLRSARLVVIVLRGDGICYDVFGGVFLFVSCRKLKLQGVVSIELGKVALE